MVRNGKTAGTNNLPQPSMTLEEAVRPSSSTSKRRRGNSDCWSEAIRGVQGAHEGYPSSWRPSEKRLPAMQIPEYFLRRSD
jgi:hypothetical protein